MERQGIQRVFKICLLERSLRENKTLLGYIKSANMTWGLTDPRREKVAHEVLRIVELKELNLMPGTSVWI